VVEEELAEADKLEGDPEELADDLEKLGPTFIKLGQVLATRPDLISQPYLEALARLQDDVSPFSYEEVEDIVTNELGVRISKAFQEFESEPIAAASLGQVHRARLRDGRRVVVKVQRPGIRQVILEDLEIFNDIAAAVDKHTDIGRRYAFEDMLEEFRKTLLRELDYQWEARNLRTLGENLRAYERIIVPEPVNDYTTSRVLTMEYITGVKITEMSPVARTEIDAKSLADDLCKAYLDQVLVEGFFHADPHPGNIFITDNGRLALLDLGMVAHLDPEVRDSLLKLLLAISDGRGHDAAQISMEMGKKLDDCDEVRFAHQVADMVQVIRGETLETRSIGRIMMDLARLSAENGIRPASELALLGKTLLNLDEIGRTLEPTFDPNQVIRGHSESILRRQMLKTLSPGKIFASMLEMQEFVQKLPTRLNSLLDALSNNEVEFRVKAIDESRLMQNLQKIANRIALGLIVAALIIGAAMMMEIETTFKILGYPAIALLLFIAAVAIGFILIFSILWRDKRHGPR
jgi:predicted unusual protein kinase regulating ubiquinone biosynthesis (AarF/ABC1/UbiB family)